MNYDQRKEFQELKMYSDRVDNSTGATVKTCNRIQIKEETNTFSKNFIKDTGYEEKYK